MKVALPRSFQAAAVTATKAMGLDVAGVDMLEGKDGPKILEINSSPGLEGIERASGIDVATAIIAHAEKLVGSHRRRSTKEVISRIDAALEDERAPAITRPPPKGPVNARAVPSTSSRKAR